MDHNDSPGSPKRLNPTRIPKFCPICGAPMTDEAVEMVMERWEELTMARAIDGELLELEIANIANKLAKSDAQKALMGRVMYYVEHMYGGDVGITAVYEELEQVKQERDAAVGDMEALMWYSGEGCQICANAVEVHKRPYVRLDCKLGSGIDCKPKWRGQKEG